MPRLSTSSFTTGGARRVAVGLGLALLVLTVGAATFGGESERRWLRVERGDLVTTVEVEGELEAIESVVVGPPQIRRLWNYKISFLAEEGSMVAAGDPVVAFDGTELRQRLQREKTARDTALKELEKRELDFRRSRRDLELRLAEARAKLRRVQFALDVPEDVVSRAQLEKDRIDRDLAQREIEHLEQRLVRIDEQNRLSLSSLRARADRADAAVTTLEEGLRSMRVTAPRAGTVVLLESVDGRKFSVGDAAWRGIKILEIPDLETMRGSGAVPEAFLGRLAVGQPATLRLDAYPDRAFRAEVTRILQSVQRESPESKAKVARVQLQLAETDATLMRPGMRFRGTIETERRENVLIVPEEAVFTGPDGAWVITRGLLGRGGDRVEPVLGRRGEQGFEVLEGLEAGDRLMARLASEEAR